MIKELNKIEEPNWGEKIQLEVDLADLQIIYDCVGAVPLKYLKAKHRNTNFEIKHYTANMFTELYEELEDIIDRHNGITDNNKNVNIDIELSIVGEENE